MLDEVKGYLQLAGGLTEVAAAKAFEAAQGLLAQGGAVAPGMQGLADDLVSSGEEGRERMAAIVRAEVDRAVARMGFVRADEVAVLRRQIDRLEGELAQARAEATAATIVAAAESDGDGLSAEMVAETVAASARRIADVAGMLDAVSGLAGGPWARVARDVAASAAGLVVSAASSATPAATPPATPPAAKPSAKEATAKKATAKKAPAKKATAKKATAKKAAPKKAAPKKAAPKKAAPKKAAPTKAATAEAGE